MNLKTIRNDVKQRVRLVKRLGKKNIYLRKSRFSKVKTYKAGAAMAIALIAHQLRLRPRIRLSGKFILALAIAFIITGNLASFLKKKEPEIKVNGQQILVADKAEGKKPEEAQISAAVITRRSPFEFSKPVKAGYLSQGYRFYHQAYDIATDLGAEITPLGSGIVEFAGIVPDGKGMIVIVDHGDGLKSLYAHMGRIKVKPGDMVNPSNEIGNVGLTGRTTGPHVHLEIYDNGALVNPGNVLPDYQYPDMPMGSIPTASDR